MLFRSNRKSTRLNSSHTLISYAVFCLKKKKHTPTHRKCVTNTCQTCIEALTSLGRRDCRHAASSASGCPLLLAFSSGFFFFFNDAATPEIYTFSLRDAFPI